MKTARKQLNNLIVLFLTIILVSAIYMNTVSADIFSGGRASGYITGYFSPSIASFGYNSFFISAMNNWGAISSKVMFSYAYYDNSTFDKYYVANTSTSGLLGQMIPYKKFLWFYIVADTSDVWAYSSVTVYDNQMNTYNFTDNQRISNITHEIGHTVSLAHPTSVQTSVMNQGIQSIGPQTYDRTELRRKWGN